ncbi:Flp family type IVb pilin [Aureimonas sp. SA4125]|uniref:Flp family type IVb pilin n=1 Tax=Aureimonas sp. SA4125 TaxID=2826993 RepID=UPI001CC408CF|nr:Flp family type IVb pilin [Aureimonas sp. SA4125]
MRPVLTRFRNDRFGATAIEYSLVAALVATALIAALALLTPELNASITSIAELIGAV